LGTRSTDFLKLQQQVLKRASVAIAGYFSFLARFDSCNLFQQIHALAIVLIPLLGTGVAVAISL
jgi:hypothetical protein